MSQAVDRALCAVFVCMTGLASALSLGCQDDLPRPTEIERMRVLGVKLSVEGDEARATPRPGERVHMRFVTVFPDLDSAVDETQLLIVSCTAPNRFTGGLPICQELIDAAESGQVDGQSPLFSSSKLGCRDIPGRRATFAGVTVACVDGPPEITLPIPRSFEAERAMFIGVLCERGRAYFDAATPGLFGCDDNDGETVPLHGVYPVEHKAEDRNHNPDASRLTIVMESFIDWRPIDGTELAEPGGLAASSCSSATPAEPPLDPLFPGVDVGRKVLTLRYPAHEREVLAMEPEQPFYEPLEITIHTTSGEIERQFTVWTDASETVDTRVGDVPLRGRAPWLDAALEWRPNKELKSGGETVRFFVTVRDQRGGFDMSTYAACVR